MQFEAFHTLLFFSPYHAVLTLLVTDGAMNRKCVKHPICPSVQHAWQVSHQR